MYLFSFYSSIFAQEDKAHNISRNFISVMTMYIQSSFNGSNIFGTMEIRSKYG